MKTKRGKILTKMPLLVALIAAPVAGYWWHNDEAVVLGLFLFFLILAATLDSWVVFWITISTFLGFVRASGTPYNTAHPETRIGEFVTCVGWGVIIGSGLGWLSNRLRSDLRKFREQRHPENEPRPLECGSTCRNSLNDSSAS